MAYEQKEGDVSLFKNDKKQPGSNQPDMRGTALLNGQKLKLSLWTKGEGDRKFLAGKIELDNYVPTQTGSSSTQQTDTNDDDLPF